MEAATKLELPRKRLLKQSFRPLLPLRGLMNIRLLAYSIYGLPRFTDEIMARITTERAGFSPASVRVEQPLENLGG
jgi:hypothetical protein